LEAAGVTLAATPAPLDVREWAKAVVRSVPPVHIENTDAVPTFKRRPDQCIDRAAVLLALEHATPAPLDGLPGLIAIHRAWHENPRYDIALDTPCPLAPLDEFECPGCGGRWRYQTRPDGSKAVEHLATPAPLDDSVRGEWGRQTCCPFPHDEDSGPDIHPRHQRTYQPATFAAAAPAPLDAISRAPFPHVGQHNSKVCVICAAIHDLATPAPLSPIVITVCPHSVDTRFTHCLLCERATPAAYAEETP
jgi:hypothetical protein